MAIYPRIKIENNNPWIGLKKRKVVIEKMNIDKETKNKGIIGRDKNEYLYE